jgi:hypothetical protein
MNAGFVTITTADGTTIATDPASGLTASGPSLIEAVAELRRRLSSLVHRREVQAA